jgi:hypothetical protein
MWYAMPCVNMSSSIWERRTASWSSTTQAFSRRGGSPPEWPANIERDRGPGRDLSIGVFLAYASACGYALLDRVLYLPKEWTQDSERCAHTGIPRTQQFATKPELAWRMLERALEAGVSATWVTGDSVYGNDRRLRMWLEAQEQAYILAVSGKEYVWLGWYQRQVKAVLAALPTEGWTRCSAGDGTKGPCWYEWCWLSLAVPLQPEWRRWLVVRRSVHAPTDLTAFVVFAPQTTTLAEVVPVAGRRWKIESSLEAVKGEVGLDHCHNYNCGSSTRRSISYASCRLLTTLTWMRCGSAWNTPKRLQESLDQSLVALHHSLLLKARHNLLTR